MPAENHNHSRRSQGHHPVNDRNLAVVMMLNLVITFAQTAGSFLSGSLALLSGALHHLANAFSTFVCYAITLAGKKDINPARASRLIKAGILSALLNAVIVSILSFFLIREAYERLQNPAPLQALVMIVVGMIGLLASLFAAGILKNDTGKSGRIRTAYNHQVVNGFSSAILITGGVVIHLYEFYWIDPLITGLICLFILRSAFIFLLNALRAVNHTPERLDLSRMRMSLEQYPDVRQVRHIQAWTRNDSAIHLEAHLELVRDLKLSELEETRFGMEELLRHDFRIHHTTLQFHFGSNHTPKAIHKE
jgi:cobalt-zinc-cadmium efflux system protein